MIIKFRKKEVTYVEDNLGNTLLSENLADEYSDMGDLRPHLNSILCRASKVIFNDYTEVDIDGLEGFRVYEECIYLR